MYTGWLSVRRTSRLSSPDSLADSLSRRMPQRWDLGLSSPKISAPHPVYQLKLFPCGRNYLVIEKEALVVKWVMDTLWYYLLGNPFVIMTDHAPLKWLNMMK